MSPNHDARPPGTPVDTLILHYTGMQSAQAAIDRHDEADIAGSGLQGCGIAIKTERRQQFGFSGEPSLERNFKANACGIPHRQREGEAKHWGGVPHRQRYSICASWRRSFKCRLARSSNSFCFSSFSA